MATTYNWAILGCGSIAQKFASDLKSLPQASLYAVASRDKTKAEKFAKKFGFLKAYSSYTEMAQDSNVHIVYIATPHAFHKEHALLCLNNKKAVLCEKAFGLNNSDVSEMIAASKKNNTFLMEAFWTRFFPQFEKVMQIVQSGSLGALKFVKSDFMFRADYNAKSRLFNLDLGGGSLLDIGIYPVFTALMLLGKPNSIKTITHFSPTGSEESISILFGYKSGSTAVLTSSFAATCNNLTELCFENGTLKFLRNTNTPITLLHNGKTEIIDFDTDERMGYFREAQHVMDCLDSNLVESPILPLSFSLSLIKLLDEIRKESGINFPNSNSSEI